MRKTLRLAAVFLAIFLPVVGLSVFVVVDALEQVPEFYRTAVDQETAVQEEASDACLRQATALASDVIKRGRWQALFTAEQINGWLAVDLVKKFPDLLTSDVHEPRIAIRENEATIACRYDSAAAPVVYSLTFDVYLTSPNIVAVRILKARVGACPVPLGKVLEAISTAAHHANLPLTWGQDHGDPVALVTIPPPRDASDQALELETIQLRDGEVLVAGRTDAISPPSSPDKPEAADESTAQASPDSTPEPRVVDSAKKQNRQN